MLIYRLKIVKCIYFVWNFYILKYLVNKLWLRSERREKLTRNKPIFFFLPLFFTGTSSATHLPYFLLSPFIFFPWITFLPPLFQSESKPAEGEGSGCFRRWTDSFKNVRAVRERDANYLNCWYFNWKLHHVDPSPTHPQPKKLLEFSFLFYFPGSSNYH